MERITLIVPNESQKQKRAAFRLKRGLVHAVGGFSEYEGSGVWTGPDGAVREPHTRIEILLEDVGGKVGVLEWFRLYGLEAGEPTLLWWIDNVEAHFEEVQHEQAASVSR